MTRPAAAQDKFRRRVFADFRQFVNGRATLVCYVCEHVIDTATEAWDADHVIPHAFGGTEGAPICKDCHKAKTAGDVTKIAKAKRAHDNHFGIRRKGWGGKWKRKMNGETVER